MVCSSFMAVVVIRNYDQVRGERVYLAYNSRLPFITKRSQGRALKTGLLALYSITIPPNQSFKAESMEGGAGRHRQAGLCSAGFLV